MRGECRREGRRGERILQELSGGGGGGGGGEGKEEGERVLQRLVRGEGERVLQVG